MSGLNLQTGLTGSAVGNLYGGQTAMAPTRTAVPEGPTTVAALAYGGDDGLGNGNVGLHAVAIGVIAAALLFCMWWGLPR